MRLSSIDIEELTPVDCDGRQLCHYCKRPMLRRKPNMTPDQLALTATRDHMDPTALGGSNERQNITAACYRDNNLKGNIPYQVFKMFANMVLIPYPDLPTPILRNSLTVYIMHLVEIAANNKQAMREASRLSLLRLADEIDAYDIGKKKEKKKKG